MYRIRELAEFSIKNLMQKILQFYKSLQSYKSYNPANHINHSTAFVFHSGFLYLICEDSLDFIPFCCFGGHALCQYRTGGRGICRYK